MYKNYLFYMLFCTLFTYKVQSLPCTQQYVVRLYSVYIVCTK